MRYKYPENIFSSKFRNIIPVIIIIQAHNALLKSAAGSDRSVAA
jgi:hypothetical protein